MSEIDEHSEPPELVRDGDILWKDGEDGLDDEDDLADLMGFDLSDEDGEDRSGLRALINSALAPSRRMPILDVVFDRAARNFSSSLRQLTNENVEVSVDDTSVVRFGEFLQTIHGQTVIAVLKSAELDNSCLVVFDSELVFSVVDLLLGGRRGHGVLTIEDRTFTKIELTLVERVFEAMCADLSAAYSAAANVTFALDRYETAPQLAVIAQDASISTLSKFQVKLDDRGGRIAILTPHATLEPIMKSLLQEFMTEASRAESIWHDHLKSEISATQVDLHAVIAEKVVTVKELSALEAGMTLEFGSAKGDRAAIRAGDVTVVGGKIGRQGAAIAIQIGKRVKSLEHQAAAEEQDMAEAS